MRNITTQQAMLSKATSRTILLHHVRITRQESKLQHPPLILTSTFTLGSKLLPVWLYHPVDRCTGLILEPCSMHMSLVIRNHIFRPPMVCRESKVCDKIPRLPPSVLGSKSVLNNQCGVVSTVLSVHRWRRHFAQIWRPHYIPTSWTSKLLRMFRKCICNIYSYLCLNNYSIVTV